MYTIVWLYAVIVIGEEMQKGAMSDHHNMFIFSEALD